MIQTVQRAAERVQEMADRGASAIFDTAYRHLSPEQQRAREEKIQMFEVAKIAIAVAVCASIIFTVIFPSIITYISLATTLFFSYEGFTAASNVLETLRNIRVNVEARLSREELINQISKNTFTLKPIISALNPTYEDLCDLTGWGLRL